MRLDHKDEGYRRPRRHRTFGDYVILAVVGLAVAVVAYLVVAGVASVLK